MPVCARLAAARSRSIAAVSGSTTSGGGARRPRRLLHHVEIARPADPAPHDRERGDRHPRRLSDARQKEPRERARFLQRLAYPVDPFGRVFAAPGKARRGRGDRRRQQSAAVVRPGVRKHALSPTACRAASARSRKANFCTLPVDVLGISAKTIVRGHL